MNPVLLEQKILKIINEAKEPLLFIDIKKNKLMKKERVKDIKGTLQRLVKKKKIRQSKNNYYWDENNINILHAVVIKINKTFGFVRLVNTDEEVFIPGRYMIGALPGDKVIIKKYLSKSGALLEGKIITIEKQSSGIYSGKITKEEYGCYFSSSEINFPLRAKLSEDEQIIDGQLVKIKVIYRGSDNDEHIAQIKSVIGDSEDPKSCCEILLKQNNIKQDFDKKVMKEAKKVSSQKISETEYKNRLDLRDKIIFTIDGADSKDLDDAVSIEKLDNGNFNLGVHIADVSYYVKEGSALDNEAYERGTSIYFADSVIPMLPKDLSNGICSLNPDEDRLAFSVFMELDNKGKILSYEFKKSVIKSRVKGVYHEINQILKGSESEDIRKKYKEVRDNIFLMEELADLLTKKRYERGSLNLDTNECKIICEDEKINIKPYIRGKSEVIIEEFMIKANEAAAMFAQKNKIPFIYRIHDNPPSDKMVVLDNILINLNLPRLKNSSQLELSKVINRVKGTKLEFVVNNIVLRSLAKAKYSSEYKPHYGLVLDNYSHFTSPIRRYPDLMIHRIMSSFFKDGMKIKKHFNNKVIDAAFKSSDCEKNADNIERECEDVYKAKYMKNFIGDKFEGIVSSVTQHGFYVELSNTVEGLVHKNTLPEGEYEQISMIELKNLKNNKFSIKVGDVIKVKLIKTDVFSGQIDFQMLDD